VSNNPATPDKDVVRTLDQGGCRRSLEAIVDPPAHIAQFVESAWIDDWTRARPTSAPFRIVADGSPHVIWTVAGNRHITRMINVVGARRVQHDVDVSRRRFTVGLRLKPGALPALFASPATRFTDRSIPLEQTVFGGTRLLRASTPDGALQHLFAAVDQLAERSRSPLDWRIEQLTSSTSAADIARALGLRDRTLRMWSHRTLGMNLKRFFRIRRLHMALEMRVSGDETHWSRIAAESGYADHSHLVRDCRALLGETPSEFVRRADSFKRGASTRR
jgi:AraC-like DNA-binding protein